jgi:uncharacterized membrane protein
MRESDKTKSVSRRAWTVRANASSTSAVPALPETGSMGAVEIGIVVLGLLSVIIGVFIAAFVFGSVIAVFLIVFIIGALFVGFFSYA